MPYINGRFVGLVNLMIIQQVENLEKEFANGNVPLSVVRQKLSELHGMATDDYVKKLILMEYDGIEIGAKRSVT